MRLFTLFLFTIYGINMAAQINIINNEKPNHTFEISTANYFFNGLHQTNKKLYPANKTSGNSGWLESYDGKVKDSLGVYQKYNKAQFYYNPMGYQTHSKVSIWENNAFVPSGKDTLIYDTINNTVEQIWWNYTNSVWEHSYRKIEKYDNSLNLIEASTFNWLNSAWVASRKEELIYNGGRLDTQTIYSDVAGVLQPYNRTYYTYNGNGHRIKIDFEIYSSSQWIVFGYTDIIIDANGNPLIYWNNHYNGIVWDTISRLEIYYDAQGNDTLQRGLVKDSLGIFQNQSQEASHYDLNGNLIFYRIDNFLNGNWVNIINGTTQVDANELAADYFYPKNIVESFEVVNKLIHFEQFWRIDSTTASEGTIEFNYWPYISIDEEDIGELLLYPNPVKTRFILSNYIIPNATLELYNLNGKLLFTKVMVGVETEIDLNAYQNGLYVLRVYNNSKSRVIKIIKE